MKKCKHSKKCKIGSTYSSETIYWCRSCGAIKIVPFFVKTYSVDWQLPVSRSRKEKVDSHE